MKKSIFILVMMITYSCLPDIELNLSDCENPRTTRISGIVLDNFTKKPIEGARLNVRNLAFVENEFPTIISGENGRFSETSTACSFVQGNHFRYDGISHPDYAGSAASWQLENMKILMFKNVDIDLVFNDTTPETKEAVKYYHAFCIRPDNACHRTRGSGEFTTNVKNTVAVKVAEGEDLYLEYRIDEGEAIRDTVNITGINKISIDI